MGQEIDDVLPMLLQEFFKRLFISTWRRSVLSKCVSRCFIFFFLW